MKKLYRVQVELEVAVVADSPEQAENLLSEDTLDWRDELSQASFSATEVKSMGQLGDSWAGAYPYGEGTSDHTCEFYLQDRERDDASEV